MLKHYHQVGQIWSAQRIVGDPETSAWRLLAKYCHYTNKLSPRLAKLISTFYDFASAPASVRVLLTSWRIRH
jgi:hypothetical protein